MGRKIIRPLDRPALSANGSPAALRPQRVAVYVRVSSEEQLEGYSLDAQLRAARATCAERGWEIAAEYVEEGRSARYDDLSRRPRYKAMLEAADARAFDVVLVHKLDRFARNLLVLLETLGRLGRANVALESCTERLDYVTPQGKLFMVLMGGIAEWYSNNLSKETKKGKKERKDQGLYNGPLPFGTVRGPDGLPAPDRQPFCVLTWAERDGSPVVDGGHETCNFEGLRLAFRLASEGMSDRSVAHALNAAGYRTSGNWGQNPFQKDTLAEVLTNRFYWGELPVYEEMRQPDGRIATVQVGWTPAKHGALEGFDEALWDRVQAVRSGNRTRASKTTGKARLYALSGLATCHVCGGPVRLQNTPKGEPRLACRTRKENPAACSNRLTFQSVYEAQIGAYLAAFVIPDDFQERLKTLAEAVGEGAPDADRERRTLEARLERIRKSWEWGDKPEGEYLAERAGIQRQLAELTPDRAQPDDADALAGFVDVLRDVALAWEVGDQVERNHLARALFEDIRVEGAEIVGVKPRREFAPYFQMNYEAWKEKHPGDNTGVDSGRVAGSGSDGIRTRIRPLPHGYRPLLPRGRYGNEPPPRPGRYARSRSTIPPERWGEVREQAARCGLRVTARAFGVSHEAVRQIAARP